MAEGLTWGGVDVASFAIRAVDLSGLLAIPARRGENLPVAGRDGAVGGGRKFYNGREFVVEFLLRGCLPDGTIPAGPAGSLFYDNLHVLAALCVQDLANLVHTLPDGSTRVLPVEVLTAVQPTRWLAGMSGSVKVAFTSTAAFWRAATVTSATFTLAAGATRSLAEFAPSDGRIDDALVTFGGAATTGNNPTLTQVETGLALGYDDTFTSGKSMQLGDYSSNGVGLTFDRLKLRTDPRIGAWWVIDPVPGGSPTLRLDLTGGGPMQLTIAARQSWAVG